jgi:nitroreductase
MNPDFLVQQLRWRYATKKFDSARRIPAETWATLEHSLVLAPSSFGLQPWKFVVVESPEIRAKLQPISWNQSQVVDASHFVVFAGRLRLDSTDINALIAKTSELRGVPPEKLEGYKNMMLGFRQKLEDAGGLDAWSARQVYLAIGGLLTSAALLGIDACPLEGIDPAGYDQILGLRGYSTLCAVALGYRSPEDATANLPKVRYPVSQVIHRV